MDIAICGLVIFLLWRYGRSAAKHLAAEFGFVVSEYRKIGQELRALRDAARLAKTEKKPLPIDAAEPPPGVDAQIFEMPRRQRRFYLPETEEADAKIRARTK